jgi:hypothetical protein
VEPKPDLLPSLSLFLAVLAALVMYLSQQPLNPITTSAPPTEFSADRMPRAREFLS